jgi:hypothetical protein
VNHLRVIIGVLCGLWLFGGRSGADQNKLNVRELCRIEVSGTLMNAYNDVDLYEGHLSKATEKLKDARLKLMLLDREYQRLIQSFSSSTPAFEVDERVLTLRFEQRTLEGQIRESEQAVELNEKLLKERRAFRSQFSELITPVFTITIDKQAQQGGYPLAIAFRHSCSQYQLLCALPRDQAEALRKIAREVSNPQACERYSSILSP